MTDVPDFFPFNDTVERTLDCYELTPKQRIEVKRTISQECPWFSPILYMRTHHAASQFLHRSQA